MIKKSTSKYRNTRLVVNGEKFDSKREYKRWCELKLLENAGEISQLERQVRFEIAPGVRIGGRKRPAICYVADAVYLDKKGARVVEDVKGVLTPAYRLKKHLLALQGIDIFEVK